MTTVIEVPKVFKPQDCHLKKGCFITVKDSKLGAFNMIGEDGDHEIVSLSDDSILLKMGKNRDLLMSGECFQSLLEELWFLNLPRNHEYKDGKIHVFTVDQDTESESHVS